MINGYVRKSDMYNLTEAEATAFIFFLKMEAERHREDIRTIEEDILYVRRIHRL